MVDLLLSNETENERIFIHHEEAINQAENTRSKTGMESTSHDLHTANTSLNPLGGINESHNELTVTAKYVYLNNNLRGYNQTQTLCGLFGKNYFLMSYSQASALIQHIRKKSSSIPWLTSEIKKLLFDRDNKKNVKR